MSRLVEYVLAVGIRRPKVDTTQSPEFLRKFPPDDHKDFPLPPDVVFFCQPEGCTTASKKISLRQTNSFVFTLTDKETGITRYGICCNFYRPCLGVSQKKHMKAGKTFSVDTQDKLLTHIYSIDGSNPEQESSGGFSKPCLVRTKSTPAGHDESEVLKHLHSNSSMLCYSLTSICIISGHPFFSTFRECLYVLRKLIESRCWNKMKDSFWTKENIYYDGNQNNVSLLECRNWAMFFNNHSMNAHINKSELLEIEEWIKNLLQVPLPSAGLNRVEVELLPRHIQPPLTFALPEKSRFSFLDFPVHLPLELLGVETCLKILTCIMLEQKVVLQSTDYNALSISVMALTSMLYPLQYMFPIIPLLPTCMKNAEQLLLAPTPYVIGIPSSFFRIKGINFQVPDDVLIIDLDTNKMCVPLSSDEIPPLPEPEGSILKAQLKQCLQYLSFSPQPIYDLDKIPELLTTKQTSADGYNLDQKIYGNDIDSVDIAVRCALVKFFCSPNVLEHFNEHIRILRLYPRPVVALMSKSFLQSRPVKSKFMEALVTTQAVEYFAEWIVNPDSTVFKKIQDGIFDPRIIGDKPRWYSHYIQPFYFQVHNPHSHLGFDLYEDSESDSDEEYPSMISEEEQEGEHYNHDHRHNQVIDDGDACSCCSSVENGSEEENGMQTKIHSMYDTSYSTLMTEEDFQKVQLTNSVFSPPPYRFENDTRENEHHLSSVMDGNGSEKEQEDRESIEPGPSLSELSENTIESSKTTEAADNQNTTAAKKITSIIGSIKPKLSNRLSSSSISSVVSATSIISNLDRKQSFHPGPKRNVPANPQQRYVINRSSSDAYLYAPFMKDTSPGNIYNSENQQLITEIVGYVKSGDGIGWLSTKRLRRIVSFEGLRQYLINQIDVEQKSHRNTLNDVHISRNVYRGYLEVMKLVVEGYVASAKVQGLGGLGSVFQFMEVAHRYYCGKRYTDDSTQSNIKNPSRKTSLVDTIKETSIKLDDGSSNDKGSNSSLHYHRDLHALPGDNQKPSLNNSDDDPDKPSLTYSSLKKRSLSSSKKVDGPLNIPESLPGKHFVTKSNCSGGNRFYEGKIVETVLEPAGRKVSGTGRRYLFEGLQRNRSEIWDDLDFWENCFLDSVHTERESAGMDVNTIELINRYKLLSPRERRLLEEDEDNLLGILLHNMIAFMLCMNVENKKIKSKVRRLLARAHIGLTQTQWVDEVLDNLEDLSGNDIDLLVPRSRQLKIQIFVVHLGDVQSGPVFFLEVREDCIVVKSTNGNVLERWWYENVVNLSCSPKTKVLCIWVRSGEATDLQKICTKKCKALYNSIKESMKKAAERLEKEGTGANLGGDFIVIDPLTGQQGILKVSLEGVSIVFVEKKLTVDVRYLKNCCAKQKILIVEEFLPHNQSVVEHRLYTEQANEICYAILCLFSYIAAAKNMPVGTSSSRSCSSGNLTV